MASNESKMRKLLLLAAGLTIVKGWNTQKPFAGRKFHDETYRSNSFRLPSSHPGPYLSLLASSAPATTQLSMNLFQDLGDLLTGGKLTPQAQLPYGEPLGDGSTASSTRTLAVAERPISFTGEDFDVVDVSSRNVFFRVRGALLHLPGKDKMRILGDQGRVLCELDRKLVALTPTYDIYRGSSGEKIAWIEKAAVAFTDTFEVHLEGRGLGPFKPPASFRLEGDFLDRNFCMKNDKGEVVAKVAKEGWIQFDSFNHYQIQVAPGMDAALVVACTCAIDEEFDEEHKERKTRGAAEGKGWLG